MRKLAAFAFSFAAGVFFAQYFLPFRLLLPLGGILLLAGAAGLLLRGNARLRLFLIAGGLALSCFYNAAYVTLVQEPAEKLAGSKPSAISMTLLDYAQETKYGAKVTVSLHLVGQRPVRAVYYGDGSLLALRPGNVVTDDLELSSAARIRDDDVTTFTSRGIFLLAYGRGEAKSEPGSAGSLRYLPLRAGLALRQEIGRLFSGDIAGFLTAILTGDKSGLSEQAAADLSEAGLSHILAVSGMHCAFLLALITLLTGRRRRRLTALVAIPVLLFYMLLTGGSPSVVRACVMLLFLLLAPLLRREGDSPTALSAALLLILLKNPFAAASVSLQLSFAAVGGLLFLTPRVYRALTGGKPQNAVIRFLAASFSATLGATVFTAPLTAYYFNTFWLVAPLSNLLCLWAAGIIFALGLPAVLLSSLWLPLGAAVGFVPGLLIRYLLWMAGVLAGLPYHAAYFSNPYLKYWLAFAYFLFGLAWLAGDEGRRKYGVAALCTLLALGAAVGLGNLRTAGDALDIVALDVGQGESVLLSSGGEFALMDCGSGNSWYHPGQTAAEELSALGCRKLEYLILSHYDSDHVNGVEALLARMDVGTLLLPDTEDDGGMRERILSEAEENGVPVEWVQAESDRTLGKADLHLFPPLGTEGDNELGLTLLCSSGDFDFLVTGDMDSETERQLTERYTLPDIEVLMVGHHGSKYSTSQELLQAVTPEVGLISVGSNSYGHPTGETLRRLSCAGVTVYRTDLRGDIRITVH